MYQITLHQIARWCKQSPLLCNCNDTGVVRLCNIFKVDSYEIFHSILICISLVSMYIGYLFICFLALYFALLWVRCSYLLPFILPLDFFLLILKSSLFIPDMNPFFSRYMFASIFSQPMTYRILVKILSWVNRYTKCTDHKYRAQWFFTRWKHSCNNHPDKELEYN